MDTYKWRLKGRKPWLSIIFFHWFFGLFFFVLRPQCVVNGRCYPSRLQGCKRRRTIDTRKTQGERVQKGAAIPFPPPPLLLLLSDSAKLASNLPLLPPLRHPVASPILCWSHCFVAPRRLYNTLDLMFLSVPLPSLSSIEFSTTITPSRPLLPYPTTTPPTPLPPAPLQPFVPSRCPFFLCCCNFMYFIL